jgi:hypothetical protein
MNGADVFQGMDDAEEFSAVFLRGKTSLDVVQCRKEMEQAARRLVRRYPDVGAIVLECTNMPPYADAVRRVTGRPVFDVVTLVDYVYAVVNIQQ